MGCTGITWTICKTICTSLQKYNHTNTSSLNFYRPDAIPCTQPTVSKHWRQAVTQITDPVTQNLKPVATYAYVGGFRGGEVYGADIHLGRGANVRSQSLTGGAMTIIWFVAAWLSTDWHSLSWTATDSVCCVCVRGVHGNGEDWDPTGPMGFPWEWE